MITEKELITQKTRRNCGVIMRTENRVETIARQAVANAVAFSASKDSASLVESLRDSYNPHQAKAVWHKNNAIAKIKKFDSLMRIAKKSCRETPWAARTSKNVAK